MKLIAALSLALFAFATSPFSQSILVAQELELEEEADMAAPSPTPTVTLEVSQYYIGFENEWNGFSLQDKIMYFGRYSSNCNTTDCPNSKVKLDIKQEVGDAYTEAATRSFNPPVSYDYWGSEFLQLSSDYDLYFRMTLGWGNPNYAAAISTTFSCVNPAGTVACSFPAKSGYHGDFYDYISFRNECTQGAGTTPDFVNLIYFYEDANHNWQQLGGAYNSYMYRASCRRDTITDFRIPTIGHLSSYRVKVEAQNPSNSAVVSSTITTISIPDKSK